MHVRKSKSTQQKPQKFVIVKDLSANYNHGNIVYTLQDWFWNTLKKIEWADTDTNLLSLVSF